MIQPAPGQIWRCVDAEHPGTRLVLSVNHSSVKVRILSGNPANPKTRRGRLLHVPFAALARWRYVKG